MERGSFFGGNFFSRSDFPSNGGFERGSFSTDVRETVDRISGGFCQIDHVTGRQCNLGPRGNVEHKSNRLNMTTAHLSHIHDANYNNPKNALKLCEPHHVLQHFELLKRLMNLETNDCRVEAEIADVIAGSVVQYSRSPINQRYKRQFARDKTDNRVFPDHLGDYLIQLQDERKFPQLTGPLNDLLERRWVWAVPSRLAAIQTYAHKWLLGEFVPERFYDFTQRMIETGTRNHWVWSQFDMDNQWQKNNFGAMVRDFKLSVLTNAQFHQDNPLDNPVLLVEYIEAKLSRPTLAGMAAD